ncbi:hypothetical protein DRN32_00050 [Thermococci archaeon]|nr:MAG: hypothetical protein DRN32_00050 [Thermococci archaeon]
MDFTSLSHEELVHTLMKVVSLLGDTDFEEVTSGFTKTGKPLNHEAGSLTDAIGITKDKLDEITSLATGLVSETLMTRTRSRRVEWLHLRWRQMSSVEKACVAVAAVEMAFVTVEGMMRALRGLSEDAES